MGFVFAGAVVLLLVLPPVCLWRYPHRATRLPFLFGYWAIAAALALACGVTFVLLPPAALAVVVGSWVVMLIVLWRQSRDGKRLMTLLKRAEDPAQRQLAFETVQAYMSTRRGKRALLCRVEASDGFFQRGLVEEASQMLEGIEDRHLSGYRAMVFNNRAVFRMLLGDLKGAREMLAQIDATRAVGLTDVVASNRALLLAIDGDPDGALAALPKTPDPQAKGQWLLARAHTLAALGQTEEADSVLKELRTFDPKRFHLMRTLPGPARPLVAALETQAPYR